jgi:DNA mismatch repair protein MutS
MAVVEEGDEVAFLRRVVPGAADRSYGLHVARLAGVPGAVLARAAQILQGLPDESTEVPPPETEPQLELFAPPDHLRNALGSLDLDAMTPLQALNTLADLKKLAKE